MHRALGIAWGRQSLLRRLQVGALGLAIAGTCVAGAVPEAVGQQPAITAARSHVIVVLHGAPALASLETADVDIHGPMSTRTRARIGDRRAELLKAHEQVLDAAHAAGVPTRDQADLTRLINAVAVSVPASATADLARLPGVKTVLPDRRVRSASLPPRAGDTMPCCATQGQRSTSEANEAAPSVQLIGAPQVWQRDDPAGVPVRGDGTTVAVIGTGIDYTHPALGGRFGPGHKVVDGYDFFNDDSDPMDDNGHGTHVAGIIAGDGAITGVAPEAHLTAYKVLNDAGSGYESDVIAGIEAAVSPDNPHQADVVNLSVSGPGDGTGPIGRAATAATELGAVVVVAAGNAGPGAQTVHGAAVADGVLSVGASVSGIRSPAATMVEPRKEQLQTVRAPYSANPPTKPVTGELVDVGEGTADDYERVGDVAGKVVAINANIPRSLEDVSPYWIQQARRAEKRGAIAMLAYTSGGGPVLAPGKSRLDGLAPGGERGVFDVPLSAAEPGDSFRMDSIVVLGLRDLQWGELNRALGEGSVRIQISGTDMTDQVASFSSQGPTADFELAPDLVAPGVEIASTWPKTQWEPGVYRLSGTSMAAAHAAGSAALLRQLHPNGSVQAVDARLTGSAAPVRAGPTVAGSGRLDVAAAAETRLTTSPAALSFGLADLSSDTVSAKGTLQLRNHSDQPVRVGLSANPATGSPGQVTVSPGQATVPAGGGLLVDVNVSADAQKSDVDLSGWLVADVGGASNPSVRVPYLLAVRHLLVRTTPDPSAGTSTAYVWSPTELSAPPELTVTPPNGESYDVATKHHHGRWWQAQLHGKHAGAYSIQAHAPSALDVGLSGSGALEVVDRPAYGRLGVWQPIGPNGTAGDIHTTPADPDMAVVTQHGKAGPWVTRNGGGSWRQLNRLPVAAGTGDLVVDAKEPGTMWYAVNGSTGGFFDTTLDPTYQGRILRTRDGGRHWEMLDVPDVHYLALVSDPATQVLVAVSADAVLVSRDGGDSWSAYPSPVGDALVGAAIGGDDVFLASSSGVSVMRGVVSGEPEGTERVYDAGDARVDDLVADDSLVAVLTGDDTVVGSRDGGTSWQQVYDVPKGGHFSAGALSLVMHDDELAVTTYRDFNYLSEDHGRSWSKVSRPLSGALETDFAPWADGDMLWASEQAGLFRTGPDGADPSRIGVQGLTAYDLAVTESTDGTPQLLAGTVSGVYRTDLPTSGGLGDRVAEWGLSGYEAYNGALVGQLAVSPQDPSVVWKIRKDALDSFWLYRSAIGGGKWELRGRTGEVPLDIVVSPHDPDTVVVPFWSLSGAGLYVTHDGGDTWKKLFHKQIFTTAAADPDQPGRLWLGSASGLYRSDDFGVTVEKVAPGAVTAIDVAGPRVVIGGAKLRVSDNHGKSFHLADSGALPMRVSDLLVSPSDPGTWYAATTSYSASDLVKGGRGVLRSTDGGQTWTNISAGLQNLSVDALAVSPDGRWLYAGTVDGGVHRMRTRE
ncbi:MAG: S8 family serine peptidase [Nocardioidaceae bacterium]